MRKPIGICFILMLLMVLPAYGNEAAPHTSPDPAQNVINQITLPPGFEISVFASDVPGARSLEWTENGTLFVGTRQQGVVYALRDTDGDWVADETYTIDRGLNSPNGVAFLDGSLYVAEISRIWRYDAIEDNLTSPPDPVLVNSQFPTEPHHGWKFIAFSPDDKLYVPVGVPCNVCNPSNALFGTITRLNPDGTGLEIYAEGVRNSVGFDWHPETGVLWFTDNGRDTMGDDIPPDELNRAPEPGMHFGFPFCHAGDIPDPGFGGLRNCSEFVPPVQDLGPHVAALGMRFYTGNQFPDEYHHQIFIAEHGSWNRTVPIGYRVTLVRLDDEHNVIAYEPFAEGWLQPNGTKLGRPVDVEVMPDGSLLVSDDLGGIIYRIAYVGEE